MNEIKIFNNPQFGEIRTVIIDNNAWLIAKDVCKVLELNNVSQALSSLDDDDKTQINPNIINYDIGISNVLNKNTIGFDIKTVIPEAGRGGRDMLLINESGFYTLVLRSNMPNAKPFRKWVTSEVLPAIRKTGGYIIATPEDTPEIILAHAILVAQDSINRLKNQLETKEQQIALQVKELKLQAPKAEYCDSVLDSEGLIATTLIAKDLGMSAATLNKKLFSLNIIYRCQGTWVVTSKYQTLGYAKSKTFLYHDQKGDLHTSIHFYWTEQGRKFIIQKLTA